MSGCGCNETIDLQKLASTVAERIASDLTNEPTLRGVMLRGDVTLDSTAREALCEALSPCIITALKEDPEFSSLQEGQIQNVARDGNEAVITLTGGRELRFSVIPENAGADKYVTNISPDGENLAITMSDGTQLDVTRGELGTWLTAQPGPLATDAEVQAAVATLSSSSASDQELQDAVDSLNTRINDINLDQAVLSLTDSAIRLQNEDGSQSEVPLGAGLERDGSELNIARSSDSGNLIEIRDDGVYYGIQAPPNLSNLYVDAQSGNDANDGSRASPLKTLQRAIDMTPEDKSNTIHVKAADTSGNAQEYSVDQSFDVTGGAIRRIVAYGEDSAYGDIYDCYKANTNSVYPYAWNEVTRPLIKRRWYAGQNGQTDVQNITAIGVAEGSTLFVDSVSMELTAPELNTSQYQVVGNYARGLFNGGGQFNFKGCLFPDPAPQFVRFYAGTAGIVPSIDFNTCQTDSTRTQSGHQPFINIDRTSGSVTASQWTTLYSGSVTGCPPVTRLVENMRALLTQSGAIGGITRNSLGVPLNLTSNFEV